MSHEVAQRSLDCEVMIRNGHRVLLCGYYPIHTTRRHPITEPSIALREYLDKVGVALDPDVLPDGVTPLMQLLMKTEVSEQAGADRDTKTLKSNWPTGLVQRP